MKRFPVILAPALLGSLLMLGGCATTGPNTAPLPPDRDCQEVYTVAPGNYIIDIAGGSMVVLDPAVQDFPLFCSPEEARAGLKTAMDNGALPAGDWRIYRLNGTLQEIGQQPEPGHYSLARMARLVDWVSKAERTGQEIACPPTGAALHKVPCRHRPGGLPLCLNANSQSAPSLKDGALFYDQHGRHRTPAPLPQSIPHPLPPS